jgi:hypothetical protein
MDQFAKCDRAPVMRTPASPGRLSHGAFLRWPPWQAAGLGFPNSPEECAFLLFHHKRDTTTEKEIGNFAVALDCYEEVLCVTDTPGKLASLREKIEKAFGEVKKIRYYLLGEFVEKDK